MPVFFANDLQPEKAEVICFFAVLYVILIKLFMKYYITSLMRYCLAVVFLINTLLIAAPCRAEAGSVSSLPISLPEPGQAVSLSQRMAAPVIDGLKIYPQNPFRFDFLISKGDQTADVRAQSERMIRYFLAGLTIPEQELWVNLSPLEANRIIPASFGMTELGRDFLAEDYILKQVSASLLHPDSVSGRNFWQKVYARASQTNQPDLSAASVDVLNKVWIMPDKALVFEEARTSSVYILEARLKVMLDEDRTEGAASPSASQTPAPVKEYMRSVLIPVLEQEVNEGAQFARLRQAYQALVLAHWYKRKLKETVLSRVYADRNKVAGIEHGESGMAQRIYERYLKAFKQGVVNMIKEEPTEDGRDILPRRYFAGGVLMATSPVTQIADATDKAMLKKKDDKFLVSTGLDRVVVSAALDRVGESVGNRGKIVPIEQALDLRSIVEDMGRNDRQIDFDGEGSRAYSFFVEGKKGSKLFHLDITPDDRDTYLLNMYAEDEEYQDMEVATFTMIYKVKRQRGRIVWDQLNLEEAYQDELLQGQGYFKNMAQHLFKADQIIISEITNDPTRRILAKLIDPVHSQLKMTVFGRVLPEGYLISNKIFNKDIYFIIENIKGYKALTELLTKARQIEKAYWPFPGSRIHPLEQRMLAQAFTPKAIRQVADLIEHKAKQIPELDGLYQQARHLRNIADSLEDPAKNVTTQGSVMDEADAAMKDSGKPLLKDAFNYTFSKVWFHSLPFETAPKLKADQLESSFVDNPVLYGPQVRTIAMMGKSWVSREEPQLQGMAVYRESDIPLVVGDNEVRRFLSVFRFNAGSGAQDILLAKVFDQLLLQVSRFDNKKYLLAVAPENDAAVQYFSKAGFVRMAVQHQVAADEKDYFVITIENARKYISRVLAGVHYDRAQAANTGGIDMRESEMKVETTASSQTFGFEVPSVVDLSSYQNLSGFAVRVIGIRPADNFSAAF